MKAFAVLVLNGLFVALLGIFALPVTAQATTTGGLLGHDRLLASLPVGTTSLLGSIVGTPDPAAEARFVELINGLRASQGLPAYAVHGELASKARSWAQTMAGRADIFHS